MSLNSKRLHDVDDDFDPRTPKRHLSASLAALRIAPSTSDQEAYAQSLRDNNAFAPNGYRSLYPIQTSPFGTSESWSSPFLRNNSNVVVNNSVTYYDQISSSAEAANNTASRNSTHSYPSEMNYFASGSDKIRKYPLALNSSFSASLGYDTDRATNVSMQMPDDNEDEISSDENNDSRAMVLYRAPPELDEWRQLRYAASLRHSGYALQNAQDWFSPRTTDIDNKERALIQYQDPANRLNLVPKPNENPPRVIPAPWPSDPGMEIYEVMGDDEMQT